MYTHSQLCFWHIFCNVRTFTRNKFSSNRTAADKKKYIKYKNRPATFEPKREKNRQCNMQTAVVLLYSFFSLFFLQRCVIGCIVVKIMKQWMKGVNAVLYNINLIDIGLRTLIEVLKFKKKTHTKYGIQKANGHVKHARKL